MEELWERHKKWRRGWRIWFEKLWAEVSYDVPNYYGRVLREWYKDITDFWAQINSTPRYYRKRTPISSYYELTDYFWWQYYFYKSRRDDDKLDWAEISYQFVKEGASIWDIIFVLMAVFFAVWLALGWHWYDQRVYQYRDPLVLPWGPDFLYSDAQKTKWHKRGTIFTFWVGNAYVYYGDDLEEHGEIWAYLFGNDSIFNNPTDYYLNFT